MAFLGVHLDQDANQQRDVDTDTDISAGGALVRTLVITAREDIEIATQTRAAL